MYNSKAASYVGDSSEFLSCSFVLFFSPTHKQGLEAVCICLYICACVHSSLFVCVLKLSWMQDKPWRRRKRRRRRAKKSNYSTTSMMERRGWEHCWDFCYSTRLSKKRRRRFPAKGIQSSLKRFWMCVKTCSLEIQHPQWASNLQFLHVFLPLLAANAGLVRLDRKSVV